MNRAIKFRGMSLNGWVYGYYLIIEQGAAPATPCIWHIGNNEGIPVEIESVGQSTGLNDQNGVDIYEGDVLRDSESIVIVKFVSGEFSVDYRTMGGKWRNYSSLFDYLEDYEGEIIGNIYENSDLLERSND